MTIGKSSLLTAGFVGVFALGVISGPTIRNEWSSGRSPQAAVVTAPVDSTAPAPVAADRATPRAKPSASRGREVLAAKKPANAVRTIAVSLWEPELRDRVKTVLNPGSRLEIAAADFDSSEEFVTVAHAAHNTNVPFMVLKDRVLKQGQSLAGAISESKPELDAKAEVTRARAAARADLELAS